MTDLILYLSLFFNVCLAALAWFTVKQEKLNEEIVDDLQRAYGDALQTIEQHKMEDGYAYLDDKGRWRNSKTGQFVKGPLV